VPPLQAAAQFAVWHVYCDRNAESHAGVRFLFVHAPVQLVSPHTQLVSHASSAEHAERTLPYSVGHMSCWHESQAVWSADGFVQGMPDIELGELEVPEQAAAAKVPAAANARIQVARTTGPPRSGKQQIAERLPVLPAVSAEVACVG
jgi:hypothetical protein